MAAQKTMTLEEFLVWERDQKEKHEYYRGHVYLHPQRVAMPGGSPNHNEIEANIVVAFGGVFDESPYRVLTSNELVVAEEAEAAFYPDAVVVRRYGRLTRAKNAVVVFEVASSGTENYDRGRKLDVYKSMPLMREIIFVRSTEARIERFIRRDDVWVHEVFEGLDAELPVLDVRIPLKRIYKNVDVPPFSLGIPIESEES